MRCASTSRSSAWPTMKSEPAGHRGVPAEAPGGLSDRDRGHLRSAQGVRHAARPADDLPDRRPTARSPKKFMGPVTAHDIEARDRQGRRPGGGACRLRRRSHERGALPRQRQGAGRVVPRPARDQARGAGPARLCAATCRTGGWKCWPSATTTPSNAGAMAAQGRRRRAWTNWSAWMRRGRSRRGLRHHLSRPIIAPWPLRGMAALKPYTLKFFIGLSTP